MLGAVVLFVAAIGSIKFFQVKAAMASQGSYQPPPETVTTTVAKREMWDTTLTAIGTVEAVKGVTISADLPGVVQEISFESGRHVNAGDVLVRLDSRQEIAQLAAAEAQRDLARVNLERSRGL
ncbi:MAG: efflux RND transporter periplasmic adaptor subunit, partial [Thermoanaerobaculia bacterium]